MALTPGTRLGVYEVTAQLGVGGMGEVYRATDTKLKRQVAIKILPSSLAADSDRLARFQREAEVLASLNHPNIAAIYGLEDADGIKALVMELVEGSTLADRIAQGAIPIDEALPIAKQIAEALEAAHEQGIIHRDLKPANIKLREDGTVKVLDFGLAKAIDLKARAPNVSQSPTITSPAMTQMGIILGTAAYMAPEQAKGKRVDKRADIWAFGCVLFEMLTGRQAFVGEDATETIAAVVKGEPPWDALPPEVPAAVRALLRRCLEKDRTRRLGDISTSLFVISELRDLAPTSSHARTTDNPSRSKWWRAGGYVLAIAAASAVTAVLGGTFKRPDPQRVSRLELTTSGASSLNRNIPGKHVAITRDGSRVVYVGTNPVLSAPNLFTRRMDQLEVTLLTEEGAFPFFRPDGQWVGFFTQRALKKVAVTGGPSVEITRIEGGVRGATWGPDDTIIFAAGAGLGLQRVASAGGEPQVLTRPDRAQGEGHALPRLLPEGRAVLFTIVDTRGPVDSAHAQVAVLDLRTPNATPKILVRGGADARYLPTGHLVYMAGDSLYAAPFDVERLEIKQGAPVSLSPELGRVAATAGDFDVADNGTLVYVPEGGSAVPERTLAWVNRQGKEEPIPVPPRAYLYPRISPDGTRVALDVREQENDIWVWDLLRKNLTRVTKDPRVDRTPVWTADGQHLIFSSGRDGPHGLYRQRADGDGVAERLTVPRDAAHFAISVSPNGMQLVLHEGGIAATGDLMTLHLDRVAPARAGSLSSDQRREPTVQDVQPVVKTSHGETNGTISPDGRWFAYQSNESGNWEIYVRPFADGNGGGRSTVSTHGGTQPHWAPDARELFYLSSRNEMMSVRVGGSRSWSAGTPEKLFDAGPYFLGNAGWFLTMYDLSKDGRFMMVKPANGTPATMAAGGNLVVVQNWTEELKRLVPAK